jgi:transcriptional regulator with XRE-family HTH domain
MDIRKRTGDKIKAARKWLRMTQYEFGEELNKFEPLSLVYKQPDISAYESGIVNIPGDKLEKIRLFVAERAKNQKTTFEW